ARRPARRGGRSFARQERARSTTFLTVASGAAASDGQREGDGAQARDHEADLQAGRALGGGRGGDHGRGRAAGGGRLGLQRRDARLEGLDLLRELRHLRAGVVLRRERGVVAVLHVLDGEVQVHGRGGVEGAVDLHGVEAGLGGQDGGRVVARVL